MQVIKKIKIDMVEKSVPPIVYAVQNDSATRVVEISLYANNIPWEVPEGSTVAVSFKKADGKTGLYDKLPDGSAAVSTGTSSVSVTLAQQVVSAPGNVLVSIVFYDENLNQLASFPFVVSVEEKPSQSNTVSNNYYKYQTLEEINAGLNGKANFLEVSLSTDTTTASHNAKQVYDHVASGGIAILKWSAEYFPLSHVTSNEAIFGNTEVLNNTVSTIDFVIDEQGNVATRSASGGSGGGGGGTSVTIDKTLTVSGVAADAKAVGDAIRGITENDLDMHENAINNVGAITLVRKDGQGEYFRLMADDMGVAKFVGEQDERPVTLRNIEAGTQDGDAVNKAQLDAALGDIETALDNIIAIQNSLIGGESA